MVKGVIAFDMDGVLVEVSESYRETIVQTVKHFRRPNHFARSDPGLQERRRLE